MEGEQAQSVEQKKAISVELFSAKPIETYRL
jgi:hypothetical protein